MTRLKAKPRLRKSSFRVKIYFGEKVKRVQVLKKTSDCPFPVDYYLRQIRFFKAKTGLPVVLLGALAEEDIQKLSEKIRRIV